MKNKRTILLLFICLGLLLLVPGCKKDNKKPNQNGGTPVDIDTYDLIYQNKKEKSAPLSGQAIYKAEYGYIENTIQGYNNFYYQVYEDGHYKNLIYDDARWVAEQVKFSNGTIETTKNNNMTLTFICPTAGNVKISGNPKLLAGEMAELEIFKNDNLISTHQVKDEMGIYHEKTLDVNKDDVINFRLKGDSKLYYNPTIDYLQNEEQSLHYTPEGYFGDVHPFYDEKTNKMYMFYLSTGKQEQPIEIFSSLLATSSNFIQYSQTPMQPSKNNPPEQSLYYALGVYVDKEGNYRSSFGYGNYAGGTLSKDLLTWEQGAAPYIDEKDGLFKYTYRAYFDQDVTSGRDPDIFYDEDSDKYYCVVMNYYTQAVANGKKGLALYIADSEGKYSTKAYKLLDCTGRGDPECPQLKKIGSRWYLFYSIYGTGTAGNVGRFAYRIGDEGVNPEVVDWNNKHEYYLDGGDLHAAQIVKVREKTYMYGWINYSPLASVWGGYLNLAREVYQREDGRLLTRLDQKITSLLNRGVIKEIQNEITINNQISNDLGTYDRSLILSKMKLNGNLKYLGYHLSDGSNDWYVIVSRKNNHNYLSITNDLNITEPTTSILIDDYADINLKIVVDGNFIEAFVNDQYGVVANTTLQKKNCQIKLIGDGNNLTVIEQKICKLADYNNIFD